MAWIHDALGYEGVPGIEIVVSGEWKGFVFYDLDVNYCAGSCSPRMAVAMGRMVKDSKGTTIKSCFGPVGVSLERWCFVLRCAGNARQSESAQLSFKGNVSIPANLSTIRSSKRRLSRTIQN